MKLNIFYFLFIFFQLLWLSSVLAIPPSSPAPSSIQVIDLRSIDRDPNPERTLYLAVTAAAGLDNRINPSSSSSSSSVKTNFSLVYTVDSDDDLFWLDAILPTTPRIRPAYTAYLAQAYQRYGAILFDPARLDLLPSVVTLAGVLSLVPIDQTLLSSSFPEAKIVLNATGMWSSATQAVNYTAHHYLSQTSTLAFQPGDLLLRGFLVDWLVSQKIFTQYLENACVPSPKTGERSLLRGIIAASPWPRPVPVFGYNSLDPELGGDLFEAETDCNDVLGQIASSHTANLAFWSRVHPFLPGVPQGQLGGPMAQRPRATFPGAPLAYDAEKVYVSLVFGDMDNLDFVQTFGHKHMMYRAARCSGPGRSGTCFPLTWTLSPNLLEVAPAILRWYYHLAFPTERDLFIMPPSGTLYSYPSEMPGEVQAAYVARQNAQAALMDTQGAVHWEWVLTWGRAFREYFPRYANMTAGSAGTSLFFLNDVPWVIPIPEMEWKGETFKVVGSADAERPVVLFKSPFNWQENGWPGGLPGNSTAMADRINKLRAGSVQYVYVIQNTPIADLFDMVDQLQPHVVVLNYLELAQIALQKYQT